MEANRGGNCLLRNPHKEQRSLERILDLRNGGCRSHLGRVACFHNFLYVPQFVSHLLFKSQPHAGWDPEDELGHMYRRESLIVFVFFPA